MKTIKKDFVRCGFIHKQIKREGDVAIFFRTKPEYFNGHYEVIKISRHNGYKMGTGYIEAAETYPGASLWGLQGWTYLTLEKAEEKYQEIKKRFARKLVAA